MKGLFQLPALSKLLCLLFICLAPRVHAEEVSSSKSPQARDMRFVHPYSNFCRSLISEKGYLLKYQTWKVAQIPVICLPYLLEIKKNLIQFPGDCGMCSVEFDSNSFKPLYGVPGTPPAPPTGVLYDGAMKTCDTNVCRPRPMNGSCTCSLKELASDPASSTTPIPNLPEGCSCNFHCFSSDPKSSDLRDKCFVDVSLKDFRSEDYTTQPPKPRLAFKNIKCQCQEQPFGGNKIEFGCQCEKNS